MVNICKELSVGIANQPSVAHIPLHIDVKAYLDEGTVEMQATFQAEAE